jgi:hypothetical protein
MTIRNNQNKICAGIPQTEKTETQQRANNNTNF